MFRDRIFSIADLVNAVLGALVSITGMQHAYFIIYYFEIGSLSPFVGLLKLHMYYTLFTCIPVCVLQEVVRS